MKEVVGSASQLDKVISCVRAAGFHYIDKIQVPEDPDARLLGTRVHKILGLYASQGVEPDLLETLVIRGRVYFPGQIAAAAFPLLQKGPVPGRLTDVPIDGARLPSGIPLTGEIDLFSSGEIRDFKTTSDFRYAKTPADLLIDTQAQIYAYAFFSASPAQTVDLHWQYLLTKGRPQSQSTRVTCTREHNATQIARIDAVAQPWVQLRKKGVPGAQLPPTGLATGACDKYRGCPYRGTQCQVTVEDVLRFPPGANMSDLASILAQKLQAQSTLAQVPPPAGFGPPAPPPSANPFVAAPAVAVRPAFWMPGDPMNEDQEHFARKGKSLAFIAQMADVPPPAEVCASYDGPKVEAGFINPPESSNAVAAPNPTVAAALAAPAVAAPVATDGDDFAALKARAQALGILPEGKNLKTAGLKKLLAEHDARLVVAKPISEAEVSSLEIVECAEPSQAVELPLGSLWQADRVGALEKHVARIESELADLVADRVVARLAAALAALARP